jgi:hypothetical protein
MNVLLASASLFVSLVGGPPAPAVKLFTHPATGFKFTHPVTWKVKVSKLKTVFTIPVGSDKSGATVELIDTVFHEPAETWQAYQKQAVEISKKRLDRQWQEEILGVPLLLTQSSVEDQISLTGLLYSMSDRKMFFKLSASAALAPDAEKAWKDAFLTLRTLDGELPKAEDPNRPKPTKQSGKKGEKKPKVEAPTSTIVHPEAEKPARVDVIKPSWEASKVQAQRGSTPIQVKAGGQELTYFIPSGWSVKTDGDKIELQHKASGASATLEPLAQLDSGLPETKLESVVNAALGDFKRVAARTDRAPYTSKSKVKVFFVERLGELPTGSVNDVYAIAQRGEYYGLVTSRIASGNAQKSQRDAVMSLINQISLEPKK